MSWGKFMGMPMKIYPYIPERSPRNKRIIARKLMEQQAITR